MTWREKYKKTLGTDNLLDMPCPEDVREMPEKGFMECPMECSCEQCYDREIPEKYLTEEEKMPTTTRKTKDEILEELENKNAEIADLKKELNDLEKYKQLQDCADMVAAMRNSFVNSGFSNDEAFKLTIACIESAIGGRFR